MKFFIDEQRIGPYSLWHHEHFLVQTDKGFLMTDIVSYSPPFGFLGVLVTRIFMSKQVKAIFIYRENELKKRFQGSLF
jgi:ligand-binding SRPBCC domain-containing protein